VAQHLKSVDAAAVSKAGVVICILKSLNSILLKFDRTLSMGYSNHGTTSLVLQPFYPSAWQIHLTAIITGGHVAWSVFPLPGDALDALPASNGL
jgi:hypothetical protein